MIAVATLLFAPTLAEGRGFAIAAAGANAPLGTQVLVGAFMSGLGMQLGNGCGSGKLFTLGGGSTRMIATIVFFLSGPAAPWRRAVFLSTVQLFKLPPLGDGHRLLAYIATYDPMRRILKFVAPRRLSLNAGDIASSIFVIQKTRRRNYIAA